MAECQHCIHESEISELRRDSERNSNQHREFYDRFAKNEKSIAISEERYNNLLSVMTEVKNSVNELKEKPAKKWDSVSMQIVTVIISGIVGYVISFIF